MTFKRFFQGICFFSSLFFLSVNLSAATQTQITQIQNMVDVLKLVKSAGSSVQVSAKKTVGAKPIAVTALTPPSTPIALPAFNVNVSKCSAPFTAVNATAGSAYNATALSCSGGLQFINIAFTDANVTDWNSSLNIPTSVLSNPTIASLMQKGMYIAINMMQNPANNPVGNYVQVCLTDVSGNVFAQSPLVQLPAGVGYAYSNIGFNVYNTETGMASNQTYVNWMPIANGQRIFYQDQGTATTVTTPGIGGQAATPPAPAKAAVTTLTPPSTSIAATQVLQWLDAAGYGTLPNDWPATATSSAALGSWPVATIQNNKPVSCAQGLQTLYVDLMNAAGTGILDCQFNIAASPILQQLAQQGLYVAVQVSNVNVSAGTSTVTVSLTDVSGNVFAATTANLASSVGATYICTGFNMNPFYGQLINPSQPATQTAVNLVKITDSSRIFYQDQGAATKVTTPSVGGFTVPTVNGSVKQAAPTTLTPPSTPIALAAFNVNGSKCSAPFTAVNATAGSAYNATALSCSAGLQFINIAFTDANVTDWNSSLNIPTSVLSNPMIVSLMKQGMYIAINMMQNPANNPVGNYVQVCLTDVSGNVFAQSPLVQLPAGVGYAYSNIGFNVYNTETGMASNQTYVNWMPIANGQRIFYKDQGTATTVTTPGIGGQGSTPPAPAKAAVTALTPPSTPIALPAFNVNVSKCSAPFTPVNATAGTAYNATALSCSGGLQFINIAFTDANVTDWNSSLNIPTSVLSNPTIASLMQKGMYIAINMMQNPANNPVGNYVQVCLTDVSGNVFAQSPLVQLPAGVGYAYSNIGFNVYNTETGMASNQTYVNWMPIANGQRIFYKDQGTATTVTTPGIGGQAATPPGAGVSNNATQVPASTTVTTISANIPLNPTMTIMPQNNFTFGNGSFVASTNSYMGYNGYNPYTVQMLKKFYVRLYNSQNIATVPAYVSFDFDFTNNTAIQNQLNSQGVACYWITQTANNQNQIILNFANALNSQSIASYSYQLPANSVAPDSAYFYFNTSSSKNVDGTDSYAVGPVGANQGVHMISGMTGFAQPGVSVPNPLP